MRQSFWLLALPAETVPSRITGRRRVRVSILVSARGPSSFSKGTGSPRRCGTGTATISLSKRPSFWAATARWWIRRAYSSCSARAISYSRARFSAVSTMPPGMGPKRSSGEIVTRARARRSWKVTEPKRGAPSGLVAVELGVTHALDTAGDDHVSVLGLHQHAGVQNGLKARRATAVELISWHLNWEAGP